MVFTLAAAVKTTLHLPAFLMTAAWTNKSFWPSYLIEVFSAHFFTNKALFKFNHRPMVILHNSHILHVGGRSVKRIALLINCISRDFPKFGPKIRYEYQIVLRNSTNYIV